MHKASLAAGAYARHYQGKNNYQSAQGYDETLLSREKQL